MMTSEEQKREKYKNMSDVNSISEEYHEADVDIVLGMPSKDCRSHGICKIVPMKQYDSIVLNQSNVVRAKLVLHLYEELAIKFYTASMSEVTKQKYFGTPYFIVNETVRTPEFVNAILERCFMIYAGKYPIIKREKYYEVLFEQIEE